jgi:hypothetical protein
MGKKQREKRARRRSKAVEAPIYSKADEAKKQTDAEFVRQRAELEVWLSGFNAVDACVSLCVSDLWLPNISSQVKHIFAFGLIASMTPGRFTAAHRLDTYADFRDFIAQLHARLPSFVMLEDFVPEADWGGVRIESGGSPLHSFYGGTMERIPDFVTAFLMLQGATQAARRDMHAALTIQDHIISNIDRFLIGSATEIEPGHLEVPAESFWATCRKVLLSVSDLPEVLQVDSALITALGRFVPPSSWGEFGDGVVTGSALPFFLFDVGGRRLPISLRNAPAAVIQLWADRSRDPNALAQAASTTIGGFLGERFDRGHVVPGPLRLMTRTERLPYTFAAVMTSERQLYLVMALSEEDVKRLPTIEKAVNALLRKDWGLWSYGAAHGVQLRRGDGTLPSPAEVVLIVVLACVSTVPKVLKLPMTSARVMPLPDFVAIFDSIENLSELDRFWAFKEENSTISGPVGLVDRFAAFRDSHALLADGAVTPNLISLDPLWGSKWRHRQLEKFWSNAPPLFPYGTSASWKPTRDVDGLFRLVARPGPTLSWCAVVGSCVVHVLFQVEEDLEIDDGRILELMVHCLADSLLQRKGTISALPLFQHRLIVTTFHAHRDMLTALNEDEAAIDERPLFSEWSGSATPEGDVRAHLQVNLRRVQQSIREAADARFEADAALAWIEGLNETLDLARVPEETRASILATGGRKPRFTVKTVARHIDVPQFADPAVPGPEHYKIARRDLAIVFKALGAKEGRYELAAAKALIDPARDKFRALVHERIVALRRDDLIAFCVEQLDALMGKYDTESTRIKLSLAHEVSYDRAESLAEAHGAFVKDSRNYRYLLECCVSAHTSAAGDVTEQQVIELVATIDWLEVLYGASDVLHNGIDVAGLELDHFYIPHVFYSAGRDERETAFATETADLKLGVGVSPADAVPEKAMDSSEWQRVNAMFDDQLGVSLSQFLGGLLVLSRWPSANEQADLRWSYAATQEKLRNVLVDSVEELDAAQADKIISLATLDPKGIRRLIGKSIDESDVPIWEHNKRGNRYTIKPLIVREDGSFRWGAAAAERAARIWRSSIANGYLPADFDWPKVSDAVRAIKAKLDDELEVMAHAIVQRGTPCTVRGIDFMRRFPKENFEDVGDYDILAFWPETNLWLVIECKYNQPAFCLKDARRLRDRIFGTSHDRAQFAKIERRRAFLAKNFRYLRTLLAWPAPPEVIGERFSEVYVSREIYWWMRNPPYDVPTQFVRVDVLDHWLRQESLLA